MSETAMRTLSDGTRWIALGSFNAQARRGAALPNVVAAMQANRAALLAAPAIVLDLRGNGGGSSDWSRQIAVTLWGRGRIDRLGGSGARVDWRVSPANLASLRESRARQLAAGTLSTEMRRWFDQVTTGMAEALARGQSLWRHPGDKAARPSRRRVRAAIETGPAGPVFVITDAGCASACLDAVDLWRALGAVHIGQTTSADTLYMDVRMARMPSGITGMSVPMKVYRGRPRGANVPVVPTHAFSANIADTTALEQWIANLPERRRR